MSHASNPTFLYDIFIRVGGGKTRTIAKNCTTACVLINSNDVVGDDLWLWRADHDNSGKGLVQWTDNPADHGLVVNGVRVSMYGLAVEHFEDHQTVWNGENGNTYFYQSEFPYQADDTSWAQANRSSYYLNTNVKTHNAKGLGIYLFLQKSPINVNSAIESPAISSSINFAGIATFVGNNDTSFITHGINNFGDKAQNMCKDEKIGLSYKCPSIYLYDVPQ